MAAPRTTTPTQLPTVVLETAAPQTPPPAPTPKRYDTVDRPRVVLTTSPEVRKLQTLFRSAVSYLFGVGAGGGVCGAVVSKTTVGSCVGVVVRGAAMFGGETA